MSPCQAASPTQEQNAIVHLYDATAYDQLADQVEVPLGQLLHPKLRGAWHLLLIGGKAGVQRRVAIPFPSADHAYPLGEGVEQLV